MQKIELNRHIPLQQEAMHIAQLICSQERQPVSLTLDSGRTFKWRSREALSPKAFPVPLAMHVTTPPLRKTNVSAAMTAAFTIGGDDPMEFMFEHEDYQEDGFDWYVLETFGDVYNRHEHRLCLAALARQRTEEAEQQMQRRERLRQSVRVVDNRRFPRETA